jgi:DNA-binding response OmpR family regulator
LADTILIVDDETDLADSCARILGDAGFECLVAYDIDDALSLFDSRQVALVLSDIKFPQGDGFELSRHVRRTSPTTPVILMTGYDSAQREKEARLAGAMGYLRKPFSNARLVATIRSLLSWATLS